jgi:hypothetical protein
MKTLTSLLTSTRRILTLKLKKLQQFVALNQLNRNNRLNVDALLDIGAASIDPVMADAVLQPVESAQQQVIKEVTDDLTKIHAGIEMPARPSGAQIALQAIQQYVSQPDIQQKLQEDEGSDWSRWYCSCLNGSSQHPRSVI